MRWVGSEFTLCGWSVAGPDPVSGFGVTVFRGSVPGGWLGRFVVHDGGFGLVALAVALLSASLGVLGYRFTGGTRDDEQTRDTASATGQGTGPDSPERRVEPSPPPSGACDTPSQAGRATASHTDSGRVACRAEGAADGARRAMCDPDSPDAADRPDGGMTGTTAGGTDSETAVTADGTPGSEHPVAGASSGDAAGGPGETGVTTTNSPGNPGLSVDTDSDEAHVLALVETNGGRMKQSHIVTETGWSKSKVSVLLSEMHDRGLITKLRLGRENIICLDGEEPEIALPLSDDDGD